MIKACILGWPIDHSRSPLIHNHWFAELGVAGQYDAVAVAPHDDFAAQLAALRAAGYIGANITAPHKETAFACADNCDMAAQRLGAVNTLHFTDKGIFGCNSDGAGFLGGVAEIAAPDYAHMQIVLLGAGGAARAILAALLDAGAAAITLVNRTADKAQALADMAADKRVRVAAWRDRAAVLDGADMLVNATSLGMHGAPPLDISLTAMRGGIVADIVYAPLETPLLAAARQAGLVCVDGLGMLLHQAVPAFALWVGQRPRVTAKLRAALIADLARG